MQIRVLSYNIHKGFGYGRANFTLPQIRDALRSADVDLVLLQEVVGENISLEGEIDDWPEESQFEFLADSVWSHFAYGKNAVYHHGHHGNALLSKHPIRKSKNFDISNHRWERRGLLHAVIELEPVPLHIICLHLDLTGWGRKQQIRRLCEMIKEEIPAHEPVLVGGDFNDWNGKILDLDGEFSEIYHSLHHQFARTFPVWLPVFPLDRIYFRGLQPVAVELLKDSPWNKLSDHAALRASFEFGAAK